MMKANVSTATQKQARTTHRKSQTNFMISTRTNSLIGTCLISSLHASLAFADSPLGFIHSDNPSAYTIPAWDYEITLAGLAVNDTIDFLDVRKDLLAGTRKLVGDSGDLTGRRAEIQLGLTSYLSAFYRRQEQDLKIELGSIASVNLLDIDDGLSTTMTAYGLKWNFYETRHADNSKPWHAASLELTRTRNTTDDYEGVFDKVRVDSNLSISFDTPQTFRLQQMEDTGWQARLLYSMPVLDNISSSFWLGYADNEASSGTGSSIPLPSIAAAFEQSFKSQQKQMLLGVGMNWQITPRMPLQLSYEYVRINSAKLTAVVSPLNTLLPSFLRGSNLSGSGTGDNHTLRGSLSYWLTPYANISLIGKLYSNQFLGVIPHYNNPLSGSFAENPYGYAGIQIGISL